MPARFRTRPALRNLMLYRTSFWCKEQRLTEASWRGLCSQALYQHHVPFPMVADCAGYPMWRSEKCASAASPLSMASNNISEYGAAPSGPSKRRLSSPEEGISATGPVHEDPATVNKRKRTKRRAKASDTLAANPQNMDTIEIVDAYAQHSSRWWCSLLGKLRLHLHLSVWRNQWSCWLVGKNPAYCSEGRVEVNDGLREYQAHRVHLFIHAVKIFTKGDQPFHTYQLRSENVLRVVVRDVPIGATEDEIDDELIELGYVPGQEEDLLWRTDAHGINQKYVLPKVYWSWRSQLSR